MKKQDTDNQERRDGDRRQQPDASFPGEERRAGDRRAARAPKRVPD